MEFYLICHGQTEPLAMDPAMARLSPDGLAQAKRLGEQCLQWGVQFLCVSTLHRAQETADAIHDRLPALLRWDLKELEEVGPEDLEGEPGVGRLVASWSVSQVTLGYERAWIRVMAALARIEIYAQTNDLERIAIVAHPDVLNLLLLNWLDLDYRKMDELTFAIDPGSVSRVTLAPNATRFDWVNRV